MARSSTAEPVVGLQEHVPRRDRKGKFLHADTITLLREKQTKGTDGYEMLCLQWPS